MLPVTVIGGYLGCGKTTLVNHLLRHSNGLRLAVLVNDFGALPIDADLIESQDGNVISLAGGCICCSYGNDLGDALLQLQADEVLIDQIVVEASGVALPGAIGSSLSLLRGFRLHCIAVLVDVETIRQHATDKYLADTIERQLQSADLVLFNKTDLVEAEQLNAVSNFITEKNPQARCISTQYSVIEPSLILDNDWRPLDTDSIIYNQSNSEKIHGPAVFDAIELLMNQRYDVEALAQTLASPDSGLVRAKGFVTAADGELKTLQIVGKRWTVSSAPSGASTGLVCIGRRGEFTAESIVALIDSGKIALGVV